MAASTISEDLSFICEKVLLDGQRLLPVDPAVNFVFLRIEVDTELMKFVYKESNEPAAEDREIIFKWEHILRTVMSKEDNSYLIMFTFRKLCAHSNCDVFVSDSIFDRLNSAINMMYFHTMKNRYGINEEQALERIHDVYVCEDDVIPEDDLLPPINDSSVNDETSSLAQSVATNDKDESSQAVSEINTENVAEQKIETEFVAVAQLMANEQTEEVETVPEMEFIAQLAIEMTKQVESAKEKVVELGLGDEKIEFGAQEMIEEKAEKESPVCSDEVDTEEN